MKFTIVLIGIISLIIYNEAGPCKDGADESYVTLGEVLKSDVRSPYQLAIDRDTSTLFFSYTANNEETFESVYINLKDNTSDVIDGVAGGFAHAVDHNNQTVYIGGRDGIYEFNYATKKAVKTDITVKNIWQMFFKNALYFTTYPEEQAYIFKDGTVELVPELKNNKVALVAVDKNNNIVFYNDSKLKKIVKGHIEFLGYYNLNAFNTDADGNLYFSTPNDIYKFGDSGIEKVMSFDNLYGFAIESESSYLIALENSVSRLNPALPAPTATVCDEDYYYGPSTPSNIQYIPLV